MSNSKIGPNALLGARSLSPRAIALGLGKSTTAMLFTVKTQKCQKTPFLEGPDYCHPTGLVGGVEYSLCVVDYRYIATLTLVE